MGGGAETLPKESEDAELANEGDARLFLFDVHRIVHHEFVPLHQTVMLKFLP